MDDGVNRGAYPKPQNVHGQQSLQVTGLRTVTLQRHNGDFGFTLRHFILYPPEADTNMVHQLNFVQPMDTIFVKKVHPESQAFYAGLKEGVYN